MKKPGSNGLTRTLVLLKPDAIRRNLTGEILKRFERKGLNIIEAQMRWIDKDLAMKHYKEHSGNKTYFDKMINALTEGPLMAIVFEGNMAIESARQLIGGQSPINHSQVGTIRADFAIEEPFNLVHGSDSNIAADYEITLWFGKDKVQPTQMPKSMTPPPIPKKNLPKPKSSMKKPAFLLENPFYQQYETLKKGLADDPSPAGLDLAKHEIIKAGKKTLPAGTDLTQLLKLFSEET